MDQLDNLVGLIERYPATFGLLATLAAATIGLIAATSRPRNSKRQTSPDFRAIGLADTLSGFTFVLRADQKHVYFESKNKKLFQDGRFVAEGNKQPGYLVYDFQTKLPISNQVYKFTIKKKDNFITVGPLFVSIDGRDIVSTFDPV